jgi:hypothetical protein
MSALAPRGHPRTTQQAEPKAPASRSFSQLSTYTECPHRYELAYERRLPRRPGVWFPAGTALHKTIEIYLRSTLERGSNE